MASKHILYNRTVRLRDNALKGFRYCLDVAGCQEAILGICPNHSRIHSSSPPDCTGAWDNEVSMLVILVAKTFHFPLFELNYLLLASRGALQASRGALWNLVSKSTCYQPIPYTSPFIQHSQVPIFLLFIRNLDHLLDHLSCPDRPILVKVEVRFGSHVRIFHLQ